MQGAGILKGMGITAKRFFKKKVTVQYPEVKPNLPSRTHGSFKFEFDKCISCNMCATACPNGVIKVESTKDDNGKKVLSSYKMNLGYCLFCGLCVKACPKDAINFKTDFDMVCYDKSDSIYHWEKKAAEEDTGAEVAASSQAEPQAVRVHKEVS